MSTKKKEEEPVYTGPPEYESLILPSHRNTRIHLASLADDLPHAELVQRATEAGIDMAGTRSKEQAVERVREAVHPQIIPPATE